MKSHDLARLEGASSRAWYSASISQFLHSESDGIIGQLVTKSEFSVLTNQRDAWLTEITLLRDSLDGLTGMVFLEFSIPRMGRRIDAVVLIGPVVFAIEFKVGEDAFDRAGLDQAWDYALDLKNFHEASHTAAIVPILVATEAPQCVLPKLHIDEDRVYRPIATYPAGLRDIIDQTLQTAVGEVLDGDLWPRAPYHPTPTIVEAARALYAQHSVEAIARHDAGAQNLRVTSRRIEELVDESRAQGHKSICFITGVPGAGKTLVGLNVATQRRDLDQPTHAMFLSGNDPLVAVLSEALTIDEVARQKGYGIRVRKPEVRERVKAFIQNIHHFRDEGLKDSRPPIEHVVIFDEAQRAWNLKRTARFMKERKGHPDFKQAEPDFLISCMDRHRDWAVIVCLVGGGQEINTGEAGIDAWLDAVNSRFPDWHMHISSRLTDNEYAAGKALDAVRCRPNTHFDDCLHLAVSMRSFRAENVSAFVKALLDCKEQEARSAFALLRDRYPMAVTRKLERAKQWVRDHARGTERFGLIASSKAQRLKPHAVDIRVNVKPVHWFLNERNDTRSSYYLEDAATEFQVQGLEVDWACVSWDGDLQFTGSGWKCREFKGTKWQNIRNVDNRRYLQNAYRVLLTRARQGMVIFVPPGHPTDATRSPEFYDATYRYLCNVGIPQLA